MPGLLGDFNKQTGALGQDSCVRIKDSGFGPVLAPFASRDAALETKRRAAGNGAEIFDLHFPCHRGTAQCPHRLAHGFIEQRGNNPAVQIAGPAFEGFRHGGKANDRAVGRDQELEVHSAGVGRSAAEAAIVESVREGSEEFLVAGHAGLAS